jgi:hypothetical protein
MYIRGTSTNADDCCPSWWKPTTFGGEARCTSDVHHRGPNARTATDYGTITYDQTGDVVTASHDGATELRYCDSVPVFLCGFVALMTVALPGGLVVHPANAAPLGPLVRAFRERDPTRTTEEARRSSGIEI